MVAPDATPSVGSRDQASNTTSWRVVARQGRPRQRSGGRAAAPRLRTQRRTRISRSASVTRPRFLLPDRAKRERCGESGERERKRFHLAMDANAALDANPRASARFWEQKRGRVTLADLEILVRRCVRSRGAAALPPSAGVVGPGARRLATRSCSRPDPSTRRKASHRVRPYSQCVPFI